MILASAPPPAYAAQVLAELRALLASDGYAATFQSVHEFRAAVLRAADESAADAARIDATQ